MEAAHSVFSVPAMTDEPATRRNQTFPEKAFYVLKVQNIPLGKTKEEILQFFSSIAPISYVAVESSNNTCYSSCLLFVDNPTAAHKIIDICNNRIPFKDCDVNLIVDFSEFGNTQKKESTDDNDSPSSISERPLVSSSVTPTPAIGNSKGFSFVPSGRSELDMAIKPDIADSHYSFNYPSSYSYNGNTPLPSHKPSFPSRQVSGKSDTFTQFPDGPSTFHFPPSEVPSEAAVEPVRYPCFHPSFSSAPPLFDIPAGERGFYGEGDACPDNVSGVHREGPVGANIFVYHLPQKLTDADLTTLFIPYGTILSAKVFVDKRTGESKGFGFVSYNSPEEAQEAIRYMNGFQIDIKRLKVQLKKQKCGAWRGR